VNLKRVRSLRRAIDLDREMQIRRLAYRAIPVASRSEFSSVVHITVFKAASQWVRIVLSDPRMYRYSGLLPYTLGGPHELSAHPHRYPIPGRSMVLTVYASRETFDTIPKPQNWRVIVVVRDLLDLLVSWHFSMRYTHPLNDWVARRRWLMDGLPEDEALMITIDEFQEINDLLLPWLDANDDPRVRFYRYEDLTGDHSYETWVRLCQDAGIAVPERSLQRVLHDYRQENFRGSKASGDRMRNKYGSGKPGSWPDVLTDEHVEKIQEKYPALMAAYYDRFLATAPVGRWTVVDGGTA
jgi:hypothetical protein